MYYLDNRLNGKNSILFKLILKKGKALQILDIKGSEALFSWFKLVLSEPMDVPRGHITILRYQRLTTIMFTLI